MNQGIVPHHDSIAAPPGPSRIPHISKEKAIKNIVDVSLFILDLLLASLRRDS